MRYDDPEVYNAVKVIHDHPRTNECARAYTRAYIDNLQGARHPVQILYILNNITHLRDFPDETKISNARNILKGVKAYD